MASPRPLGSGGAEGKVAMAEAGAKPALVTDRLRIAFAQLSQRVGDLAANAEAMLQWRKKAAGADLIMFPELQLTGYPPEDLVLKPEFVRRTMEAAERLVDATADGGPAILFGTIHSEGGANFNAFVLAEGGGVVGRTLKRELPNYGVFDEKRVFVSGPMPTPLLFKGVKIGVPICEDIWLEPVLAHLTKAGAELMLVPNASPYEIDKDAQRQRLVRDRVVETGLSLAYLNRVGGQDELVFDGSSFIVNDDGETALQMPDWEEALAVTDWVRQALQAVRLPRRHLPGNGRRPAGLCRGQRISGRHPGFVGRDRQRLVSGGRGRRARCGQGPLRDDAVQIHQRS
jgi:NAD+ synthase